MKFDEDRRTELLHEEAKCSMDGHASSTNLARNLCTSLFLSASYFVRPTATHISEH